MRILEKNEIDQVSGAGLLGLNLNLGVLDILHVNAKARVGDNDGRGRRRGHSGGCHSSRRRHCW